MFKKPFDFVSTLVKSKPTVSDTDLVAATKVW